jgi:hypothetical protein
MRAISDAAIRFPPCNEPERQQSTDCHSFPVMATPPDATLDRPAGRFNRQLSENAQSIAPHKTGASAGNKSRIGKLCQASPSGGREKKAHETHFADWFGAVCIDGCNECVRFRQAGNSADGDAERCLHSGEGRTRARARPRTYAPRRPRPPLRMVSRPRASLWLARPSPFLLEAFIAGSRFRRSIAPTKRHPVIMSGRAPGGRPVRFAKADRRG